MATYIFSGKVIPERAAVSITPVKIRASVPEARLEFDAVISIAVSQVSVVVEADGEVNDLPTLRNYVEWLVRIEVDAFGYLEGRGYDVEITSVTGSDGSPWLVFGVEEPALQQSKSERPVNFAELWKVLTSDERSAPLQRALGDLRQAIRARHDTGFFCYRAVESIRQSFVKAEGRDNSPSWERLRKALRIDQSWLTKLAELSRPLRHGAYHFSSSQERELAMQHAWKVVDRFVEYARHNFQPLPEAEFEVLKEG